MSRMSIVHDAAGVQCMSSSSDLVALLRFLAYGSVRLIRLENECRATRGKKSVFSTTRLSQNFQYIHSHVEHRWVPMLPMVFRGCFFFQWCPPLNKSRRLRAHAGHWWAQGGICGLAWGFLSHRRIVYSFASQPLALRISLCRQQKHRRVLIKASVGLAFGASRTMSDICSRSPWHPQLTEGF